MNLPGLTPRKFAIALAYTRGYCVNTIAEVYDDLCPRQVRRKIDYMYKATGTYCKGSLATWLHAHGLGFMCPKEWEDYLHRSEIMQGHASNREVRS